MEFDIDLSRTREYVNVFKQSVEQGSFPTNFEGDKIIQNLLSPLERVKTAGGFLNLFETMANPEISWSLKKTLYETQLKSSFEWIIQKDLEEQKQRREEQKKENEDQKEEEGKSEGGQEPPPQSDESKSSMEADQEKGEGAPKEYFTISPFYGGYAKSHAYNKFDLEQIKWLPGEKELKKPETQISYEQETSRVIYGLINGGKPLAIPLYYNMTFDIASLKTNAPEGSAKLVRDDNGLWYLLVDEKGVWKYEITMGSMFSEEVTAGRKETKIEGKLPEEIKKKISEFKGVQNPEMKIARELVKFIRGHLIYSNSHDAWKKYSKVPQNFFTEIWSGKEADCHVANTLAVRVLNEARINARFIGGHYIKNKNEKGEAIMHAGSGHAWLEVWDSIGRKWVRLDATPKGAPEIDEKQQEKDLDDKGEGDYGGEDEIMSKEKLDEMMKKMKNQGGNSKTQEKTYKIEEKSFAEEANCTAEQAKEFFKAIDRVREIKDEHGERVTDILIREWKKIVEERKIEKISYQGPVRMDEGDNLVDPVSAVIDVKSKELNPLGFEKITRKETLSYEFGGINIFFSFDLSGSMTEADIVSGRSKADVQRDTALLFIDSLMQCAFVYRREADQAELMPLKIMATLASSRGLPILPLTDKWGPKEQWAFYSALNKLAKGGTPTHETLLLIENAYDKELIDLKKKSTPSHKIPLNYVIELSDGMPDDFSETTAMHDKLFAKKAVVRAYVVGGGEIDRKEYATIDSFSKIPQVLSKDILEQFQKLHPRKIKS